MDYCSDCGGKTCLTKAKNDEGRCEKNSEAWWTMFCWTLFFTKCGKSSTWQFFRCPASVSVQAGIYEHAVSIIEIRRIEDEAFTFLCNSVLGTPPNRFWCAKYGYSVGLPLSSAQPLCIPISPNGLKKLKLPRVLETKFRVLALDPTSLFQQMCLPYLTSHLLPYKNLCLSNHGTKSLCRLSDTS